ncbi:MAG TPA: protein kinase [Gemmatimonadaceae bacterium]
MNRASRFSDTPITAERWARLDPLIDAALELPPEQRSAYVDRACTDDPSLRADLERLLSEAGRGDSLIDSAAAERFTLRLDEGTGALPGVLGDRFDVEREIGRGGMATVFLARDRKHDRPVAVKVLRPDIAAGIGVDRFLREIRTAASLQHPHIVPLHDSGEAEGFLYYVMPYLRGDSLRERLEREPQLPLEDALRITRDVAGALDHAHANGIVHRDIKPENIFLSGGHALVMDFGIARAVSASVGGDTITHAGIAVGTPAYMSPEQGAAEPKIDARADVYALGCVVYEMLGGHPPFLGRSAQEILARHSRDPVPPLRSSRPEVPEFVESAIRKALAKSPADRYPSAGAFSEACTRAAPQPESSGLSRRVAIATAALAIAAGVFASAWLFRSRTDRATAATETTPSIAVLAFKNIGGDSSNAALSDGIAEEIATTIGRIPGLSVKAPRSSFSLRGKNLTIAEIGRALDVGYLLDGSLQKNANRLRVRVALLAAANDSIVWTSEYDRPAGDVFAIQDEIAREVAGELSVQLAPANFAALSRRSTESPEAHELYLRGRFFFQRRDLVSLGKAREYFERAIAKDPRFALALAGLGDTYSHSSAFGYVAPRTSMPKATEFVDRALALDSTLVEAHAARAFIATFYDWDWPLAGREFRKAIALDPRYPSAHLWRVWYLLATDSIDEGMREARQALALEPFSVLINTRMVSFLYYARKYDEAVKQAQTTIELDSTFFHLEVERARVLVHLGRCDDALRAISRAPEQTGAMTQGIKGWTLARCGRHADAVAELNHLLAQVRAGKYVPRYALALIQAGLGNREAALAELEAGYTERSWSMFLMNVEPAFDGLRDDPRFVRLVARMRLRS